jgi:hypothetical protein
MLCSWSQPRARAATLHHMGVPSPRVSGWPLELDTLVVRCRGAASALAVHRLEARAPAMRPDDLKEEILQKRNALRHASGAPAGPAAAAAASSTTPPRFRAAAAAYREGKENLSAGAKAGPDGVMAHLVAGLQGMNFGEDTCMAEPASPFG